MNEFESLEAELRAFRPRQVSNHLRRRIADRLPDRRPATLPRPWSIALAGGLAAACLAAIVLWWRDGGSAGPKQIVSATTNANSIELDPSSPTVLAYGRMLARSPEKLDALLRRHNAFTLPANSHANQIHAFRRSDLDLYD